MHEMERRGEVAVVRMAHGKANAFDLEFCRGLRNLFRELRSDPARAVVLTGSGSIFSAGVDLLRLRDGGAAYATEFVREIDALFAEVVRFPRPVVAAVNGHAVAGGCVLAQACDHRILAEGPGTMGVPELRVGVPYPPVAFALMRAAVGPSALARVVYGGETFGTAEALALGLVDETCPPGALYDRAMEVAGRLAAIPRPSFEITKRQVRDSVLRAAAGDAPVRIEETTAAWNHPEVRAALAEYVRRTLKK